jgi:CRISPR-associated endoribonuclease Cas6
VYNVRVQFRFQLTSFPLCYRLGTLSIIKEMIRNGSESYYHEVFERQSLNMKPFAYSTYFKNLQLCDDKIISDELVLTVSSSSYDFVMHLLNGSYKQKEFEYKDYPLRLIGKRLMPRRSIQSNIVTFKTLSPILIESKEKKPILSTDKNFDKEFQYISTKMIESLYHRKPYQPIRVKNTSMVKQVIKEDLHNRHGKPIYLTANKGLLELEGHCEDLQCIYDSGVGFRRSLGLGLLEIEEVNDVESDRSIHG